MPKGPGDPPKIELDPDLDPWDQQPTETTNRYGQFVTFRDLGPRRTIKVAAEQMGRNYRNMRGVAAGFRWWERAQAWDKERDRLHQEGWLEERRKAAENDAKLLGAALAKVAQRLENLEPDDMTVGDMTRMLDVVMRNRRQLFGDPTSTIALTGPDGDPLTIYMAEFTQMPPDQRRVAIAELGRQALRRQAAIAGVDDDDQ